MRSSVCAFASSTAAMRETVVWCACFLDGLFLRRALTKRCSSHSVLRSSALMSTSISSVPLPSEGMFSRMMDTTRPRLSLLSLLMPAESCVFSSYVMSRDRSIGASLASTIARFGGLGRLLPRPPPPPPPRLRPPPPRLATTTSGRATTSATETTRGSQPRTRTPKTRASSTSSPWVSLSARARSSRTGSPARPSTCSSSTRGCLSRSRRPGCCLARCCCRRCTAAPSQRRWPTSAARWAACSRRSPRRCLTGPTSSIGATATVTTAPLTITTRRLSPRRSRRPWGAARCRPPRTSLFRCSSTSRCRPRGAGTARRRGRHPRRRMLIRRSWPRRRRRRRRSVQPVRRRGARPWRVRCP
mmetsp:Transcript_38286/g.120613  ORF Transcript_38286/g.120613 Transcript_38286/m.120613 type:complete len:358 (+) Transcript_38286:478-1551(+)